MKSIAVILLTILVMASCEDEGSGSDSSSFEKEPSLYQEFDFEDNGKGYGWHDEWARATWTQNHTQMTVDRAMPEDGKLHIMTTDYLQAEPDYAGDLTALGGSVQTKNRYLYGKWEARLKPSSESGVVNAFFLWNDVNYQEVDIEFTPYTFGKNTGEVHLAIHAEGRSNHFVSDVKVDFNPSDDFHVYTIEVYTDRVVWRVDGDLLDEYEYDDVVKIDTECMALLNGWSSTSEWVKGPPAQTAHYFIDWVKFFPCTSGN
ncbi:MAG: family 16 glycosylhydrolase [Chitinispirillaceae bacterium]|nr:family 16 glycosylhydrolase [Chitinispirillaceae bacterium]MBN2769745.1 family 16 glycosylhydrolase [Spirochaetota bacterium]